jgi:hypothetical protein
MADVIALIPDAPAAVAADPDAAYTPEALVEAMEDKWRRWMEPLRDADGQVVAASREVRFLYNLGMVPSADAEPNLAMLQIEHLSGRFTKYGLRLTNLWNSWRSAKLDAEGSGYADETRRFRVMADYIWYSWVQVYAAARCAALQSGAALVEVPQQLLSLRFTPMLSINLDSLNHFQKVLLFLLDRLCELGYRRYGGECYEQIRVRGIGTHAWRRVLSVDEFVYSAVSKELHAEMWISFTQSSGIAKQLIEHLKASYDAQFPPLHKTRGVIAFANGVYACRLDERFDQWFPYEDADGAYGQSVVDLAPDLVACNFIDYEFASYRAVAAAPQPLYADIPTPVLQSILDYQGLEVAVCGWIYVMLGRFLYKLNEMDEWQVIMFFKGVAGSGKSTLCKMAASFYEHGDVGVLSNNIERQFGLSQFINKMGFIAPELKRDLQLDQADFQTIVSGEQMTVAQKFKDPRSVVWEVPGLLGGNEVPNWTDNSGSISRRLLVVHFANKVQNGDSKLAQKLKAELPAIILKCNLAYLAAVLDFGDSSIWSALPEYFKQTQRVMAESCNALVAFLGSDMVKHGADQYCLELVFKRQLQEFIRAGNYSMAYRWEADFYRAIFDDMQLRIDHDELPWPMGSETRRSGRFIIGCSLPTAQQ